MERSEAVQFTAMIDVASHYAIVAPLRLEPDILAFSYPLDGEIWIATIIRGAIQWTFLSGQNLVQNQA